MLSKQSFEPLIFLLNPIAFSRGLGVELFQAEDFLLEGLDVLLFPFTVGADSVSGMIIPSVAVYSPLRLSIKFLSSRHGGLAIRLRSSSFGRLAIYRCFSLMIFECSNASYTFCLLLLPSQLVQEWDVAQWALFTRGPTSCEYCQHRFNDRF